VYIADIRTILPEIYESEAITKRVYCTEETGISPAFAEKIVRRINIRLKPLIIDPDALPEKVLLKPEYSALNWGVKLVDELSRIVPKKEIGFLGTAYNVSSVSETLPNLSARIIISSGLNPDVPPEEKSSYGCASGILVLERAMEYCREHNKAAIVYVFDQCSWAANVIKDRNHPEFKNTLINSLLFGDGGAGLLLVPSSMKDRFDNQLLKIRDIQNAFEPADIMHFDDSGIQLDAKIHEKIPLLAKKRILDPLLNRNKLAIKDIPEWSIHQGGIPILEAFHDPDLTGLSEEQLSPSRKWYKEYGNLSSASAFFVLAEHFSNTRNKGTQGLVLAFGAGFYLGGLLYEKE